MNPKDVKIFKEIKNKIFGYSSYNLKHIKGPIHFSQKKVKILFLNF